jgi:hypothetical protein
MKPLSIQGKLVLGSVVIVAVVAIGVLLMVAASLGPSAGGSPWTIKKTDRQVYLLGTSSNTDIILEQLRAGTSQIVQISSLSQLPANASNAMLFIDGQWPIGQPNATYTKTAAALAPLILNGTPVVIIDGDNFVFQLSLESLATDGTNVSYVSQQPGAGTANTYGLFYNQTTGFSSSFGSTISDPHDKAVGYNAISAYNWADGYLSGAQPGRP